MLDEKLPDLGKDASGNVKAGVKNFPGEELSFR